MDKILLAFILLLVTVFARGQTTAKTGTGKYVTTSGTSKSVNSSTDTAFMQWKQTDSYKSLGIVLGVVRGSGTVTGKALIQVNNQVVPTSTGWVDYDTDTFSVSSTSVYKAKKWKYDNPSFAWWRVYWWQTSGTDTLKLDYFYNK